MTIRVLLVDDDPLVRQAVASILGSDPEIEVVGEASDGDEVVGAVAACRPDVVLMDLGMPRVNGIDATALLQRTPGAPPVLVLTTWTVDDAVVRALAAGAAGFLLKGASPDEIKKAVRALTDGDAVLSPRSTRQLLDHLAAHPHEGAAAAKAAFAALTEREREIAVIAAEGITNAEIAERVFLSPATVKSHLATIQLKLGVPNRTRVAVLAERAGLLRTRP